MPTLMHTHKPPPILLAQTVGVFGAQTGHLFMAKINGVITNVMYQSTFLGSRHCQN